jgi:hypothetical protein
MLSVPDTDEPAVGDVTIAVGAGLLTVTVLLVLVPVLPRVVRRVAEST